VVTAPKHLHPGYLLQVGQPGDRKVQLGPPFWNLASVFVVVAVIVGVHVDDHGRDHVYAHDHGHV
jgi:hypothetical protein